MSGARAHSGHDSWNSSCVVSRTMLGMFLSAHTTGLLQVCGGGTHPRSLATVTLRTCSQGNIQHTWADSSFPRWDRETTQEQGWDSAPSTPLHTVSCLDGQTTPRTDCHPFNLLKESQESTRTLWPGKTMAQVRFHGQL